jgi:hypothetical protein
MAKFSFRKPRIISKKFPEMVSHIDGVTKSLEGLVFSYSEKVDKTLHKKYLMLAISSLVFLVVIGSFISPKGKADSSIFYPESCLGGWINPPNAQGEITTTSNGDESQFTKDNSAILPKNTNAEMYCGNFKGEFDAETNPTKILVSLALTKGVDVSIEAMGTGTMLTASSTDTATSSPEAVLMVASSTSASSTAVLETATTSPSENASTTVATSTDVITATSTVISPIATETAATEATITPVISPVEPESFIGNVLNSVKDSVLDFFTSTPSVKQETDTVIVPPPPAPAESPAPEPVTSPTPPTSYFMNMKHYMLSFIATHVFAEEVSITGTSTETTSMIDVATSTVSETIVSSSTLATTTDALYATTSVSEVATSTIETSSSTQQDGFLDNFLEVFYTFDGVTWISLGDLNEISMKYRTFEIPVTASTSWSDMGQLQIKIEAKKRIDETPTVYLDGIKVEVLYETVVKHVHPDFTRDTILKDEIVDGVRVVTIINNDTMTQEVWYMRLEENIVATSTLNEATSTQTGVGSSTQDVLNISTTSSSSSSTSTDSSASTPVRPMIPVVDLLKQQWKKFEGKDVTLATHAIVEEIKKQEVDEIIKKIEEENALPNFASDTIKRLKGSSVQEIVIQIEKQVGGVLRNELWLYDTETGKQEKIGSTASTTIAQDSPLGIKDGLIFWLSEDKATIYAYRPTDKYLIEQPMKPYDIANGERAEIAFDGIPWTVIVGSGGFTFFSSETGEVFSDEDSRIVGVLRNKLGLDTEVVKDQLRELNLLVEESPDAQ